MLLRTKLILKYTKSFSNTNRLGKVFFMSNQKISKHSFQVYRIIHILSLSPPYTTVPKVSIRQITSHRYEMSYFISASDITTWINSINLSNVSLIFGIDGNYQKSITSKETRLIIAIADIIVSEGISFNLSKNQYSRRYWIWQGTSKRHIFLLIEILYTNNWFVLFINRTGKDI